jgi:colicin import membrane protein
MASTVEEMESERAEKVATERAKIEKADKAKAAKANKAAKAERERVAKATAERKAKEAAKPAAKPTSKKKSKTGVTPKLTDAELVTAVKKVVAGMDNPTPSGVVKAVRASGVSAAGKRIRAAFQQATKGGKSKASKKAKGTATKVREKEAGLGIHH